MTQQSIAAFVLAFSVGSSSALAAVGDDPRLVDAARARDVTRVEALIKERAPIDGRQPDGATALHWAAHWDEDAIAERLLKAGADVHAENELGVTPLDLACTNGSASMVRRLIAGGARVDHVVGTSGVTALMTCARTGSAPAVQALLERGAPVNAAESFKGQTALMWAIAERHHDVVRLLIAHGADVRGKSTGGFTPLLFAAQRGDAAIADQILEAGASIDGPGTADMTALLVAVESGHAPLVTHLLKRGADVNGMTAGRTALHAAIQAGRADIATDLLTHGADVNARLKSRLPRVAGELTGGPLSMVGATPFWLAAKFGDLRLMRLLAKHGADATAVSQDKTTPLMVAAGVGWVDGQDRYGRLLFNADLTTMRQQDLEVKINAFHVGLFASFLDRLRQTPDGDGSLLDHVMLLYGCGISDSDQHLHDNLPVLVAGGGAGWIRGGRHLRYPPDTPMANLQLTLLDKLGVRIDRLGDSNGSFAELSGLSA